MDLRDVFGHHPNRPNHPDMWKLSEVLLMLDSGMESNVPNDEKEALFQRRVKEAGIDHNVLTHVAVQRAMRLGSALGPVGVQQAASAWIDGFVAASYFAKKKEPGDG